MQICLSHLLRWAGESDSNREVCIHIVIDRLRMRKTLPCTYGMINSRMAHGPWVEQAAGVIRTHLKAKNHLFHHRGWGQAPRLAATLMASCVRRYRAHMAGDGIAVYPFHSITNFHVSGLGSPQAAGKQRSGKFVTGRTRTMSTYVRIGTMVVTAVAKSTRKGRGRWRDRVTRSQRSGENERPMLERIAD